jgi:uncharacterized protein
MRHIVASITATLFLIAMVPNQATFAASFNCSAPRLAKVEQDICGDEKLSALDSKLGSLYAAARSNASDAEKAAIVATQRTWMAERNKCPDFACLNDAYKARIAQMSSTLESTPDSAPDSGNLAPSPPTVSTPEPIPSRNDQQVTATAQPKQATIAKQAPSKTSIGVSIRKYWDQAVQWAITIGEWAAAILVLCALAYVNGRGNSSHRNSNTGTRSGPSRYSVLTYRGGMWQENYSSDTLSSAMHKAEFILSHKHEWTALRIVEVRNGQECGTVWSA